jgi:S-adenosylmethionine-diacylglycerol 3-amino-3-carboxypropyl transferase
MPYFSHLNYSLGDEDTGTELALLPERVGNVAVVAGSGARVLPLLSRRPRVLTCVDVNAVQLALTQCRFATLKTMELDDFLGFWGYPPAPWSPSRRHEAYECLPLSAEVRACLDQPFCAQRWGPLIYAGRFEQMLQKLARINRVFTGERGARIFESHDIEDQRRYFEEHFPRRAWGIVVFLLANSAVLNTLLYRGAFPRENIPGSARENYAAIFRRLFRQHLVRQSFFLQVAFLGELRYAEGNPVECEPSVYAAARAALPDVEVRFRHGDIFEESLSHRPLDFVSLSDVPSFLAEGVAEMYLQKLKGCLNPSALVVARGHMRVVRPRSTGFEDLTSDHSWLLAQESTQLWTIQVHRRCA